MKITVTSQLRVLYAYLFTLILTVIICLCTFSFYEILFALRIWAIQAIILGAPIFLLHTEYYNENKNMEVFIGANAITIIKAFQTNIYTPEQIKNIEISKSAALRNGSYGRTPFESYFYVCINLVDGRKLYLTSMLDMDIDEKVKVFKDVEIIWHRRLFSFF